MWSIHNQGLNRRKVGRGKTWKMGDMRADYGDTDCVAISPMQSSDIVE